MIAQVAWNIVFGGCLAIVSGWFGSRRAEPPRSNRPGTAQRATRYASKGRHAAREHAASDRARAPTSPMVAAAMRAASSTPAAATSLATFASGWIAGLARSTTASRAVLHASPTSTRPIASSSTAISTAVALTTTATAITATVASRWTRKFGCVRTR